mmetsp:Transcript_13408/g.32878  ORF Transcript_13408/g.32878 Transcript_13408/m.32878 type:complete len:610 (+) Transcript_13408:224-2053(+)|eukprot:CAMPEP_0114493192 /NCGR_PEP_ID=MMETSP0109-20121206/3974_1 /TAXON_ID=29199 /ORGANISM="Chlorarachnion reptans, Strain CCCM449" /LENGTH=609 /DNA_ID=CAMNT_0001670119 /DNA_START=167 /DNA_END=1996 /DNA_ORIENTATION=+
MQSAPKLASAITFVGILWFVSTCLVHDLHSRDPIHNKINAKLPSLSAIEQRILTLENAMLGGDHTSSPPPTHPKEPILTPATSHEASHPIEVPAAPKTDSTSMFGGDTLLFPSIWEGIKGPFGPKEFEFGISKDEPMPITHAGHEMDHKHHEHWHTGETERSHPCYRLFDFGFLEHWKEQLRPICTPGEGEQSGVPVILTPSDPAPSTLPPGGLQCRKTVHPRLNAPTAPHTICDGKNVVFNPRQLTAAKCCKHRPGYMCGGKATYHHYAKGAFQASCNIVDTNPSGRGVNLANFPADHLKDIFDSWEPSNKRAPNTTVAEAAVTMFVTREKGEHVNMYHTLTDWYMAWQTLRVIGVAPGAVQVIILDNHDPGPLDGFWDQVISRGAPMRRAAKLEAPILAPRAVWSPPGYSNMLLGKNWNDCKRPMRMMEAFVADVDDAYEGAHNNNLETLKILFIPRRPYVTDQVDHKFVGRQIDNQDEVIEFIKKYPGVELNVVDFAHIPLKDQIHAAASSDAMIGMHGAALAHSLWLPSWGGLLEMGSRANLGMFFHKIARWAGIHYENWINPNPRNYREDSLGDYTKVDLESLEPNLQRMLEAVKKRKEAAFQQ